MIDNLFGIMKRGYYLIAVLITCIGVVTGIKAGYVHYTESKLIPWSWANAVPNTESKINNYNIKLNSNPNLSKVSDQTLELLSNSNNVGYIFFAGEYLQLNVKFLQLSKDKQDQVVKEIQDTFYLFKTNHDWLGIIAVILVLPMAILLHKTAHWIIWGKLK